MSIYWGLKKRKTDKKYIVIRHPLRFNGNINVNGIKFCAGCGVVEEGSKAHREILKLPMFKKAAILPLSFLKKVGFKPKDIQLIFGYDIYYHFIEAIGLNSNLIPKVISKEVDQQFDNVKVEDLVKEDLNDPSVIHELDLLTDEISTSEVTKTSEQIVEEHKTLGLCSYINKDNIVCSNISLDSSPSGYCFGHIRFDNKRNRTIKRDRETQKEE